MEVPDLTGAECHLTSGISRNKQSSSRPDGPPKANVTQRHHPPRSTSEGPEACDACSAAGGGVPLKVKVQHESTAL